MMITRVRRYDVLLVVLIVTFAAWAMSHDHPIRRLQKQFDAATQVVAQ